MTEFHEGPPTQRPAEATVTRAVVWNQTLWTAGYSLTSGAFLVYFGKELGANSFMVALLLVVPETSSTLGLLARWWVRKLGNRKRVWFIFSLGARFVSLGIPLLVFPSLRPEWIDPLVLLAVLLAVSQAFQSVAYLSYISWIADLTPEAHWGRFFSIRNIAKVLVLLVVPVVGGYLRDWWRRDVSAEVAMYAYVVAFGIGITLLLCSMIPLIRLPEVITQEAAPVLKKGHLFERAFRDRSMRFLLIHSWWLSLANGLTQAAFFGYLFGPLGIGLGTLYLLFGVMRLVKLPVSWWTGKLSDERGNKWPLFAGVAVASLGMVFWLLAEPERWWWVFGAYVLWGFFAMANIAGRNLVLKLSPRGDNTVDLGLFRLVGGFLAGISGLLGGLWLDHLRKTGTSWELAGISLGPFQILFLVSLVGRMTSLIWLFPVQESSGSQKNETLHEIRP
ncbi:MAG: hypothetical protein Tsb009_21100 [Planctomycetaceae bacterium]